jgi:predicted phosphodiesterase
MTHEMTDDELERRAEYRARLVAHRNRATRGEELVPLAEFQRAARAAGRSLSADERTAAREAYLQPHPDETPVEGPYSRVLVFGGVYSNHLALAALLETAKHEQADAMYCLGDLGGFGPNPEKIWPLVADRNILCIQGNYEESLAAGRNDCNCGYTDPRDNHFARLSYRYTAQNCSAGFKAWMGELPRRRRVRIGDRELMLVHGSPRRINEFLFASASPVPFLEVLMTQEDCDGLLFSHTGLPWHRRLPSGRDAVNVGVLGRPANDGDTRVRYCVLEDHGDHLSVELRRLRYDHVALATEMRHECLPEEFVETIETGWWTTCLEILPARERAQSKY